MPQLPDMTQKHEANYSSMKILITTARTQTIKWFREDMIRYFIDQGHEVYVIGEAAGDTWKDYFIELSVTYLVVPFDRNGVNPVHDLATIGKLLGYIREIEPDIVFSYLAKAIAITGFALRKFPDIAFYPLVAGLGSIIYGSTVRDRIIRLLVLVLYKMAFRRADTVILQNVDNRDYLVQRRIVSESKTAVVNGSGVNLCKFRRHPVPDEPVFLFIGRLLRDKGIREYIDAASILKSKYHHAVFRIVGSLDTNPSSLTAAELDEYTSRGSIEYCGETDDVRPYINACSVLVLPSYHEGVPKAVLEAMSVGRMIITTNAPGCKDTTVPNENGLLVEARDTGALLSAMEYAINNPQERRRMGEASRRIAEKKFDVRVINESLASIMKLNRASQMQ